MTKKVLTATVCLACACAIVCTGARVLFRVLSWSPEPVTTAPEPPKGEITVNGGWIVPVPDGCVCGKPRGDGRMCDVYFLSVSDTVLRVWSDVSTKELGSVAGIERVYDGLVTRDPRYTWQSIVDGICALANEAVVYDGPLLHMSDETHHDGAIDMLYDVTFSHITIDCCACCEDDGWLELEVSGFCPPTDDVPDDGVIIKGPVCEWYEGDYGYSDCCDDVPAWKRPEIVGFSEDCPQWDQPRPKSVPPLPGNNSSGRGHATVPIRRKRTETSISK